MNIQALIEYICNLTIHELRSIMQYLLGIDVLLMILIVGVLSALSRERKVINFYNPTVDGCNPIIWHKQYAPETTLDKILNFVLSGLFDILWIGLVIVTILLLLAIGYSIFLGC